MKLQNRSLKIQFLIILAIGLLLVGGSGGYGLLRLADFLDTYEQALHIQVANQAQILIIESDFKKQVQEWKNVLLRGYDPANLDKYWGKFEQKEQQIKAKVNALLPRLANAEAKQLLETFLVSHGEMGRAYRNGLRQYKAADFDPKVGDRVVKGIDRAPTKQLGEAAAQIASAVEAKTMQLRQQSQTVLSHTALLALASVILFILLGAVLVQRQIIKPTQQISACLSRFAEGDFTAQRLPAFHGELGVVAECTANIKQHLGDIMQDVRKTAQDLSQASTSLNTTTQETQHDLQQQQADIQQVATAMDQMSAVVVQVTENTRAAADAADQAKDATLNGRTEVEKSIEEINGLAGDVEKASAVIQQLESDVANIATVLDVIHGIAEQTNLLALNAAIEAARAGEQGRGFAVVADEVRTLAGRTQQSTSEIQEMIEKLESGTAKAVAVMQHSHRLADRSVEQSAAAGTSLDTIAQAVSAINEMNQQIAVSTREQATVTEEIHQSITRINDLSHHTSNSADLMAASGESVTRLAENMDRLVQRFKS